MTDWAAAPLRADVAFLVAVGGRCSKFVEVQVNIRSCLPRRKEKGRHRASLYRWDENENENEREFNKHRTTDKGKSWKGVVWLCWFLFGLLFLYARWDTTNEENDPDSSIFKLSARRSIAQGTLANSHDRLLKASKKTKKVMVESFGLDVSVFGVWFFPGHCWEKPLFNCVGWLFKCIWKSVSLELPSLDPEHMLQGPRFSNLRGDRIIESRGLVCDWRREKGLWRRAIFFFFFFFSLLFPGWFGLFEIEDLFFLCGFSFSFDWKGKWCWKGVHSILTSDRKAKNSSQVVFGSEAKEGGECEPTAFCVFQKKRTHCLAWSSATKGLTAWL